MREYLSFFRIRFTNGLQYRAAAWAGVATQFAWGFLSLLLYKAFYADGQAAFPMSFPELSSYIWLQQALLALFMSWYFDNDIFNSVTSGSVAYELCRPADLYTMWFVKNMAVRVSRVVLRCAPILLVAVFLPEPMNISLPASPVAGALFLLSLTLGFLVTVSFSMLIYISAFSTISPLGMRILAASLVDFLSGGIVPLAFFPDGVRAVVNLLPFASMQNAAFQIYIGYSAGTEAMKSVLLQLFWLAALAGIGKAAMGRALKKVVIQGG